VKHRRTWIPLLLLLSLAAAAATDDYQSAKKKFDQIGGDQLKPGARVVLSPGELNAYARQEAPPGVRNTSVRIVSPGVAQGSALVDFGKMRRAQGYQPGWLMSRLLDGERPVNVTARITSGKGRAQVDVQRVEISGVVIDGKTLEFLIENLLLPLYPDAAVNRPFELKHHIERFEVQPSAVGVVIGQ
jgi:hypothetical protein